VVSEHSLPKRETHISRAKSEDGEGEILGNSMLVKSRLVVIKSW
jgi:hypothetical protein